MKTHIARVAILGALSLSMLPAHAQGGAESTIASVLTDDTNASSPVFFVYLNAANTGGPACATDTSRFAVDATASPTMVATILAAYANGSKIAIVGTWTCSVWGGVETVRFAQVFPS